MARGGGTGPRNKKKRADAALSTSNGSTETDAKQIADAKANIKPTKNRQKKVSGWGRF